MIAFWVVIQGLIICSEGDCSWFKRCPRWCVNGVNCSKSSNRVKS